MAEALWRLRGGRVRLLTAIGDDADGHYLASIAPGLLLDGCIINKGRTPSYAAVMDSHGECLLGLGDMALHNHITPELVDNHIDVLKRAPLVVLDGNAPQATIDHVQALCHQLQKPVFFEPTDRRKATKPLRSKTNAITYTSPNLSELRAMAKFLNPTLYSEVGHCSQITEILKLCNLVQKYFDFIVVTMGSQGVVTVITNNSELKARLYSIKALHNVENVSGAGDCFASGFIHGILSGYQESQCIFIGLETAKQALLCSKTVPSNFNFNDLLLEDATFKYVSENEASVY